MARVVAAVVVMMARPMIVEAALDSAAVPVLV
jgi:hypothetical protein